MKFLLATCFLLALAGARSDAIADLAKILVSPFISQCICATGVNPVFVERWITKFEFPNDACFKCFLKCIATSLSLIHPDGTTYVETFIKIVPGANLTINDACTNQSIAYLDLCERAWVYGQCYASSVGLV